MRGGIVRAGGEGGEVGGGLEEGAVVACLGEGVGGGKPRDAAAYDRSPHSTLREPAAAGAAAFGTPKRSCRLTCVAQSRMKTTAMTGASRRTWRGRAEA